MTIMKLPQSTDLVDRQFFQVPGADGILKGFQYDTQTKTLYARESQIVIPSLHGITHIAEDPIPDSTCDNPGLMSADDKCKLESLISTRIGVLGFQGSGMADDGGFLQGDIILAAGSGFISLERIGNVIRFRVDSPIPLSCNCFPGDERVLMNDGTLRPIKDVNIGDSIITHNGSIKKVVKHLTREFDGNLIELDVVGHSKIKVTPEHPFYAINQTISKVRKKALKTVGLIKEIDEEWIIADQLQPGDYISRRFSHTNITNIKQIDLLKEDTNAIERNGKVYPSRTFNKNKKVGIDGCAVGVPRFIDIDSDLLQLLGYYLAEGCYSERNGIRFTINTRELQSGEIGHDILRIMRDKFGLEGMIYNRSNTKNAVDIKFNGKILGRFLQKTCGSYSKTKKISSWVLDLSSDMLLHLLAGFIIGDGYIRKMHDDCFINVEIPNENLISQLAFIADKAGIPINRPRPRKNCGFSKPGNFVHRLMITARHAPELFKLITGIRPEKQPHIYNYIKTEESVLTKIRNISKIPYKGLVYNLEVEDEHTYIVNGLAVHNCEDCAKIFWIQDESETRAIRPPSCNGIMPDVNAYGTLKIYAYPENTIFDPANPTEFFDKKSIVPSLTFTRYQNAQTPYEAQIETILKRNANNTAQTGWAMTPGTYGIAQTIWWTGIDKVGAQLKFELNPETEPGLLGSLLSNGHLITKQMAVITDIDPNVINNNQYHCKLWDIRNATVIGEKFTATNIWKYTNPENTSTQITNPKQLTHDGTKSILPIGTLIDIWQFEITRVNNQRTLRSFFNKEPQLNPESLWAPIGAIQFGDIHTARDEENPASAGDSAGTIEVSDTRLFEKGEWGLTNFDERFLLSDDGGEVESSDGTIIREPSAIPINNDIIAESDPTIPGLIITKQIKPLTGDLNGDGIVDDEDLRIFMCAYNSTIMDARYLAAADFNSDGTIDIRDLAILGQQFDLNIEKVSDRAIFLWHRQNIKNALIKLKIAMPRAGYGNYPPYDILLRAPIDSYSDIYLKILKRGVITTGPFAGLPFIVGKGHAWRDLPGKGVLRILTGAYRNVIWQYNYKTAFANWDDDAVMLISTGTTVFPFDEDFPIGPPSDCTVAYTGATEITAITSAEAVEVPTNTTVVELLRRDFTAPCARLQFSVNDTSNAQSVQMKIKVGILDMNVLYELDNGQSADDLVRGFQSGACTSQDYIQNGFITDGVGSDIISTPSGFRCYYGGELDVPSAQGEIEKWNEITIMLKETQAWIWFNDLLITPNTQQSSEQLSPVAVNTPYFPLPTLTEYGKIGLRLFPGAIIRNIEIKTQTTAFNEYTNGQLQLIS